MWPQSITSEPSREYPDGNQPMYTNRLNQQIQTVMRKLGMPVVRETGFVTHSLRHFFETFCINSGIPQRVVDVWMGHHGDRSMGAIYYNPSDDDSQKFMTKVPFDAVTDERVV